MIVIPSQMHIYYLHAVLKVKPMVLTKHTVFKDVFLVRGQVTGKQWDLLQPKDGEGGEGGTGGEGGGEGE